jgi:hypothetical protein
MDTDSVIESLAAKLAAADLDDAEIELLRTLIAEPAEVAGFGGSAWGDVLRSGISTKGYSFGATQTGSFQLLAKPGDGSVLVGDEVLCEVHSRH